MINLDGYFKDFTITDYYAEHEDGRRFWIASGRTFFRPDSHKKSDTIAMGFVFRWRLWRELKRECRRRILRAGWELRK